MIKKRLLALFIDYFIIALAGFIILYLSRLSMPIYLQAVLRSLVYMFTKDSFTGQSIGRRLLNISIIDKSSSEAISPVKALVRNIFLMIWPIEIIVLFVTGKRIGDIVTNSRIVNRKVVHKVLNSSILIFFSVWVLLFGLMWYFMTNGLTRLFFQ